MPEIDFIQDLGLVVLVAAAATWICQRFGVPVLIGYLTAGVLMGPQTPFALVPTPERIQFLAHLGLVFLLFSMGQNVCLQRLKHAGLPLVLATMAIAAMILVGCRLLGTMLGWPAEYSLVLAGMLMISSSAVVSKSLRVVNASHSRYGQIASTVTALDDLVAVVMLTVLMALTQTGTTDPVGVLGAAVRLSAVIIAAVIAALLIGPLVLNRMNRGVPAEVRSLGIVSLLLALALLATKAGFVAALSAFLLGAVVSTTRRDESGNRVLGGLCDVFTPVFFVAIGMWFDFRMLIAAWPLLLGILLIALVGRTIAATGALLLVGHPLREAVRAALCLTPIGEFSLIIILLSVQSELAPASFYSAGIAVCLLTSLATPVLAKRSRALGEWLERRQPGWFAQGIEFYHEWVERLKRRRNASLLWRLTMPRIVQVIVLACFVSGLLLMVHPLYALAEKWVGADWPVVNGLPWLFWFGFGVLLLAPLVALWRHIEALTMICAESATRSHSRRDTLQPLFQMLLQGAAALGLILWLAALVPYELFSWWGLVGLIGVCVALAAMFWRKLIRFHSRFEIELRAQLADSPFAMGKRALTNLPSHTGRWELNLAECSIKENSQAVARSIASLPLRQMFSCTIVSIERQGITIPNPGADTILFPQDVVLLLGQDENLRHAINWLNAADDSASERISGLDLAELSLEQLTVPTHSRHVGKPLASLALNSLLGIQIIGIERNDRSVLSPGRSETLQPGDQLLVLGTPEQVNEMAFWLAT